VNVVVLVVRAVEVEVAVSVLVVVLGGRSALKVKRSIYVRVRDWVDGRGEL
jgi:hypothetical protein